MTMSENQLRDEMCRIGQSLFARGYVHATAGNISVQLGAEEGGGFLITPTDACLGFLDPARLAKLDANGQQISGDRGSKTIVLHRRIYATSATTGAPAACIIHTHSTHCVALTLNGKSTANGAPAGSEGPSDRELLPALTPYFVMKVGHVPVIGYRRPGDPQAAEAVARAVEHYQAKGTPIRAVMLERLGPNVWHDSPAAAMAMLEELEETAKLWHLMQREPGALPAPLAAEAVEELRETFGAHW
jgi:ribulose-5-phosphate 4-epimerase/fuculose-1-phosphate aldolase